MTYKTTIHNGHHYVDMQPETDYFINKEFHEAVQETLTAFFDGLHNLAAQIQRGIDRMPKKPQPTVEQEDQPKRVTKEKDKPVRIHPGRDNK